MNARTLALLWLALLLAAGCRSDPHAAMRERELRLLEDRIYELEDLLAGYEQMLESGTEAGGQDGPAITRPSSGPAGSEPARNAPPDNHQPPATREIPRVEMPGLPVPPGQIPDRLKPRNGLPPSGGEAPPAQTAPGDAARSGAAWRAGAGSARAVQLTLNELFTGGYDADGRAGDEGITASIEPRDADGRLVPVAAPVSVVLLDPAQQGEAARVARWEFSAEEIAAISRDMRLSEGIHLAMTWPQQRPPAHQRLHLFVRYTTADGRDLQADRLIDVDLQRADRPIDVKMDAPDRQARRWTPVAPTAPAADVARQTAPRPSPAIAPPTRLATRPARPEPDPEPDSPRRARPAWSPYRQ